MTKHPAYGRRDLIDDVKAGLDSGVFLEEPRTSRFARVTVWTISIAFLAFLTWAALTPVHEVVSGSGEIRPEGLISSVEHLEGGIVKEILVEEGAMVAPGTPLVLLDAQDILAEQAKVEAEIKALEDTLTRVTQTLAEPAGTTNDATVATRGFDADSAFRRAQIEAIEAAKSVTRAQMAAARDQIELLRAELEIVTSQLEVFDRLSEMGALIRRDYDAARRDLNSVRGEIAELSGQISVQDASLLELEAERQELLSSYRRDAALRLEETERDLVSARKRFEQLEQRRLRTSIRATAGGRINSLGVTNPGQVVRPGDVVAEIVPQTADLFADVEISADRIGSVAEGRAASLKILTHDFTRFGDVDAIVVSVSPTSTANETGQRFFRVRLAFDGNSLGATGTGAMPRRTISPGMTVSADIKLGQKTVLSYLLKPVRVLSDQAFSEG
ncbi:MAG: HlyD family type I secretion periplasmic adaptor subunit [Pseudomonadota bacterium]